MLLFAPHAHRVAWHACAVADPLDLYAFRFLDPVTGRWMRARYRATAAEIAARYANFRLEGAPERRPREAAGFDPFARSARQRSGEAAARDAEPAPVTALDAREAELLGYFLRRYVTYCARRGAFAAMNGAARLLREIAAAR